MNSLSEIPNKELKLAHEFIEYTNKNLFLTGKAGTGKTTFLHQLRKNSPKRMAVVAPTGVAAINAGGVTIHSFFQLSFGPQVPEHLQSFANEKGVQKQFNREKINLIKSLDLLVIDEISMVRADMLDAIDQVLRKYKNFQLPFGGVQLLMIGDLHQLPPVVKDDEWNILSKYYDTAYFFGSKALQMSNPVCIELKYIYRQSDQYFINLLNKIRENQMDFNDLKELNQLYNPHFKPNDNEGYITLCSHNNSANDINVKKLTELSEESHFFTAEIWGDFPKFSFPTEEILELKVNSQVMFVKNDSSREKNYFNGKIGRITRIEEGVIYVKSAGENKEIAVVHELWENIKYSLNDQKEIKEDVIGSFKQYPLKLAWAITIHKSQGLTFEKVIIDAGSAFAHGQVYVALSRCKTFEGIVLKSQISNQSIRTDQVVETYTNEIEKNIPDDKFLTEQKAFFQKILLLEVFDFKQFETRVRNLIKLVEQNAIILLPNNAEEPIKLLEIFKTEIIQVSEKFTVQINEFLKQNNLVEENISLQERLKKSSEYFTNKIDVANFIFKKIRYETDNKAIKQSINESLTEIEKLIFVKTQCFKELLNGFNSQKYIKIKANADIDFSNKKQQSISNVFVPKDIKNKELYIAMKQWREEISDEKGIPDYIVLQQKTLVEIVNKLPQSISEMVKIKGFGRQKAKSYGDKILSLINEFVKEKNITEISKIEDETYYTLKSSKPKKESSKEQTLSLFKQGKTIEEIAKLRQFAVSTIEGHLAEYIELGEINVKELLSAEKIEAIEKYLKTNEISGLKEVKEALGDSYSYSEIKFVMKSKKD